MDGFRTELYGDRAAPTYDDRYADFRRSGEMFALLGEYADSDHGSHRCQRLAS